MKNQLRIWFYLRNLHLFKSWLVCVTTTQQTHKRWYLVENETWVDVHLSTLFQRWQNNVEATSIELCWFNIDEPMLFQHWNLVEIGSWADVCLSALFQRWQNMLKQHWKNYINSMSMTQCCFNVDIWIKIKVESMYVHRRCFDVEKTASKQLRQLLHWSVLTFTRNWLKNKLKLIFQE